MASYLVLNLLFIIAVCLIFKPSLRNLTKAWYVTLFALLLLTAIFDNVIIALDIVNYDSTKLLGLYIHVAPVEDFMYTLLAVILIPSLWHKIGRSQEGVR